MNTYLPKRFIIRSSGLLIIIGLLLIIVGSVYAQSLLPGTPLTTESGNEFRPVWSPDGTKIAYFSNQAGNDDHDIWLMDADGKNQIQLTSSPSDDRHPYWSSDGAWIVYDSKVDGVRNIWIISSAGSEPQQLTFENTLNSFPSWSPDDQQIAYYSYHDGILDLMTVDVSEFLQGGQPGIPQVIFTSVADEKQNQCTFACHVPAWSPDGQMFALTRQNDREIWLVGANGDNPRRIGDNKLTPHLHFPVWKNDGSLIVMSQHNDVNQMPVNDVLEIDTDGNNTQVLYSDIPHGGPFYWKSNEFDVIAFHSPRLGNFDIFMTNLKDGVSTDTGPLEFEDVKIVPTQEVIPTATQAATEVVDEPLTPTAEPQTESIPEVSTPFSAPLIASIMGVVVLAGFAFSIFWLRKGK